MLRVAGGGVRARMTLVLRVCRLCGSNALYTYGCSDCRILEHCAGAVCGCVCVRA